jgi:hypothetical protein
VFLVVPEVSSSSASRSPRIKLMPSLLPRRARPAQVSLFPHPFSISSPPDPDLPGRFTVHAKCIAPKQWSHSLLHRVLHHTGFKSTCSSPNEPNELRPHLASGSVVRNPLRVAMDAKLAQQLPPSSAGASSMTPAAAAETLHAEGSVPLGFPDSTVAHPSWFSTASSQLLAPLSLAVTGPFGRCSLQLQHYQHFVLIGKLESDDF